MSVVKSSSEDFNKDSIQESLIHESKIDEKLFKCMDCGRNFKEKFNLNQHMKIHLGVKPFSCNECKKQFSRKHSLEKHKKTHLKISKIHNCVQCPEEFLRKRDLLLHIKKMHAKPPIRYHCVHCPEDFSRKLDLMNHKKKMHTLLPIHHKCELCPEDFTRKLDLLKHMKKSHAKASHPYVPKDPSENIYAEKVKHLRRINALNIFSKTYFDSKEENNKDLSTFFNSIRTDLCNELNFHLHEKRRIKWYASVKVNMTRTSQNGDTETITPYFCSKNIIELLSENISSHIDEAFAKMTSSMEKFHARGSNWKLLNILHLELSTAKYTPF